MVVCFEGVVLITLRTTVHIVLLLLYTVLYPTSSVGLLASIVTFDNKFVVFT